MSRQTGKWKKASGRSREGEGRGFSVMDIKSCERKVGGRGVVGVTMRELKNGG